jgi:hypothetical protein
MQSEFDTTTKLLLALTGFMAIMVGLIAYIAVFREPDPLLDPGKAPEAIAARAKPEGEPCDATDLDAAMCPAGKYCKFDVCVPVTQSNLCGEGKSCRDCECEEGLLCHHFRCAKEEEVDRTPLECEENQRLAEAVQTLARKCAARKTDLQKIASTGSCTTADWEALALEDEKFDLLLSAFPNRMAIHFPHNLPHLTKQTWPTAPTRAYLLAQIRQFKEALKASKQVFVIGRASPDGDAASNHLLAVRRMDLASQLVESVIYEGIPETERDKQRIPLRSFTLPTTNPINPARYKKSYLSNPDGTRPKINPIIAWDEDNQRTMQVGLDGDDLDNQSSKEWQRLYGMINRVVLIIPIPCLGDEYERRKTILDQKGGAP